MFLMGIIALLLVVCGLYFFFKSEIAKSRERNRVKTEGEKMKNRYVIEHEKKLADDVDYNEYLEWCKFHGELALDKKDFETFRKKEREFDRQMKKALE